jgi:hypothetical protein
VLEGIDVGAVNQRLEAACPERCVEAISEGYVFAGVGDEDFGFGFLAAFPHGRIGRFTDRRGDCLGRGLSVRSEGAQI